MYVKLVGVFICVSMQKKKKKQINKQKVKHTETV